VRRRLRRNDDADNVADPCAADGNLDDRRHSYLHDDLDADAGSAHEHSAPDEYSRTTDEYARTTDEYARTTDEHARAADRNPDACPADADAKRDAHPDPHAHADPADRHAHAHAGAAHADANDRANEELTLLACVGCRTRIRT
jgi:hypothetical protein